MGSEITRLIRKLDRLGCRPIVVASHPRSGTHLCIDTLRLNFPQCASWKLCLERADMLYLGLDHAADISHPMPCKRMLKILSRIPRPLVKTHATADLLDAGILYPDQRIDCELSAWLWSTAQSVYVYRDGREALVSLHRFMKGFAPEARVTLSQFIRQRIDGVSRVRRWAEHVENWMRDSRVYCIAMEELLHDTDPVLAGLAERLGMPRPRFPARRPARCGASVAQRVWRRIRMCPPSTEIAPDPRIGRPLSWRDAFNPADREFFREECGDLLIRLGYEESDDWVHERQEDRRRDLAALPSYGWRLRWLEPQTAV